MKLIPTLILFIFLSGCRDGDLEEFTISRAQVKEQLRQQYDLIHENRQLNLKIEQWESCKIDICATSCPLVNYCVSNYKVKYDSKGDPYIYVDGPASSPTPKNSKGEE